MAKHLSTGCASCTRVVALIERIHREASVETTVPEQLVRAAKAVFPVRVAEAGTLPDWLSLPCMAAQLVYTSMAEPAPEGARTAPDETIQVMYHAGDYAIDLQIEREPESAELALVGQIVNRMSAGAPMPNLPVVLMARTKLIAKSHSNRFGEFCLVSKMQGGLRLCIPLAGVGRQLEIPLTRVMAGLQ